MGLSIFSDPNVLSYIVYKLDNKISQPPYILGHISKSI